MLLPYTGLIYYGSATGAMVDTAPVTTPQLDIKADKRLTASIQGGQIEPYIKGTRGKKQTLIVTGLGELQTATWKKRGRVSLSVSIGASPSAFDISQAVWGAIAAQNDTPGTMGEAMNGAGGAGNPWITDLSSYDTPNTAGKILKDRLSKNQFLGLK